METPAKGGFLPGAALAFAMVFLTPSLLYGGGGAASVDFPFGDFVLFALPATLVIAALLFGLAALFKGAILQNIYLALAIAVAVKVALLPSAAPALDGEPEFLPLSSPAGIASVAALLIAVVAGAAIVKRFGRRALGPALAAMVAISLQPLLEGDNWRFSPRKDLDTRPFFSFSRNHDNVLVVLIDGFQSDVFAEILEEEPELRTEFRGFTYFYNTLATATYTLLSMPPIYSGLEYQEGSIEDFYKRAIKSSFFTDFKAAGYETALGGHLYYECPADHCYSAAELNAESPARKDILAYLEAIESASLRLAPTFLHDWIYNGSKGRLRSIFAAQDGSRPASDSLPAASVVTMESFERGISVDNGPPTLKFLHIMTTHAPIVLDADCRLVEKRARIRAHYKDQARCGLRGFTDLLEALRGRGLYDDMTIVLLADHGGTINDKPQARKIFNEVIPYYGPSGGRLNPLFAVKPKRSNQPLALSSAPLQVSDLRATLCAIAIGCAGPVPGANAFDGTLDKNRKRRFIDYGPSAMRYTIAHDELPKRFFVEYNLTGSSDELKKQYNRAQRRKAEQAAAKS